jgi:WD40 repeat protein
LHANGFTETFLDFDKHAGIQPGAEWERTLYREIAGADAIILILTKNWFDSKWCFAEFTQARALGKAIFPLIESPTGETFVSSDIQHLDLVKDREGGLERLAANLTNVVLNARGGFHWDGKRPPYPGLLAFDEADAAIYFGRDDDIRRVIERFNARRAQGGAKLIAVLGASGSGKSSLLRAGVLPRLKHDKRNWIALPPFRPQLHPLEELAQAVADSLGQSADWRHWRDAFAEDDLSHVLSDLARDLRAAHSANEAQILITIDQAEELFGAAEKTEAEKFLRVINSFLDERLPFLVVMALRSDYLGQLQEAPGLTSPFEEFSLKPMPLVRIRDVIEGPAKVAGLSVDDALVSAAMNDAATDDALPLLAFAFRELYDRFGQSGRLTVEAYKALGDEAERLSPLENAVRRKADEVIGAAKPTPEDLQALKEAFVPAMVRVNAEGEYARRPARFDALPAKSRPLIERLAKARLLIIKQDRDATTVEVAHEALLRKWPLLRGWLDEEREFLIGKDQLEEDLRDWEKAPADQKTDALLSGLKLTRARSWLVTKPQQLTESEGKFIQASIAHHDAEAASRERSRRRVLHGSMAAAAVLAIVAAGAIWALTSANDRESQAVSRQLAAKALEEIATAPGMMQTAIAASQRWHTDEAEVALNRAAEAPSLLHLLHDRSSIESGAFSPDGKRIVTASWDGTARVWDSESGNLLVTLAGHGSAVTDAAFSPDGTRIVTAGLDKTARLWDAGTGHILFVLTGHTDFVRSVEFSSDGKRIVTSSDDNTARVWDSESGNLMETLTGQTCVEKPAEGCNGHSAVFSPDGKRIATADAYTTRVWDTESGRPLATLTGNTTRMNSMMDSEHSNSGAFSPDGKRIVTAGPHNTARVWDAGDGRLLVILSGHSGNVLSVAFSPDGNHIVTAGADNTVRVWNAADAHLLNILSTNASFAAFSPDGKSIVTPSGDLSDNTVRVWDSAEGHLITTLTGHTHEVNTAIFSSDSARILTANGGGENYPRVWDLTDRRHAVSIPAGTGPVFAVAFSPDGKRIITGSDAARIWSADDGHLLMTLPGDAGAVRGAAFSPDSSRIVTVGADHVVRVWNAVDGRQLIMFSTRNSTTAAFSQDGTRIVTSGGGPSVDNSPARLWDAADGHELAALELVDQGTVNSAVFSSDGKHIVTASSSDGAQVWNAQGTKELGSFGGSVSFLDAAISPDGSRLVATGDDKKSYIWDASDSETNPLEALSGHTGAVNSAAFSPDGKRIVTASKDGTVRLWDVENGQLLATYSPGTGAINAAVFSPDGRHFVTAGTDGIARIYIANFDDLLKLVSRPQ